MRIGMYSLHDIKMGLFLAPFAARNDVEAGRQIKAAMSDPQMRNADFVLSPGDFTLSQRGIYDDETGRFEPATSETVYSLRDFAPSTVTP